MIDLLASRDRSSGQAIAHPACETRRALWLTPQVGGVSNERGGRPSGRGGEDGGGRQVGVPDCRTPVGVSGRVPRIRPGMHPAPEFHRPDSPHTVRARRPADVPSPICPVRAVRSALFGQSVPPHAVRRCAARPCRGECRAAVRPPQTPQDRAGPVDSGPPPGIDATHPQRPTGATAGCHGPGPNRALSGAPLRPTWCTPSARTPASHRPWPPPRPSRRPSGCRRWCRRRRKSRRSAGPSPRRSGPCHPGRRR